MAARATYRDCHGVGGGKNGKRKRYLERETGCNQTEVFCPGISSPWTYSEKGILCLPPGLHKELVTPALGRPTHPVPVHRKAICLGVGGVSTCAPAQPLSAQAPQARRRPLASCVPSCLGLALAARPHTMGDSLMMSWPHSSTLSLTFDCL
ncbi:NADH dehydrogenase [ubiquinone] iron-sulfur protein 6, mitochondrial isoform X4 [Manis javanica]|uniref:NADH dehydrogenase [ubiquinone] iron-sulfur protein 6, mitochondrial isoform X4 n=1 Tax=Manis javanica TaxID=9974 RepID=UPI001879B1F1|nr:NADH dehydrogenase [ubiquinone] iron-sulfur protein 6, mitochondrial isoform X4 [Manis javanica]